MVKKFRNHGQFEFSCAYQWENCKKCLEIRGRKIEMVRFDGTNQCELD